MSETGRILLVEDDHQVAKCSMKQLQELGCLFRATTSHSRALAVIERDPLIDTVLLDHGATDGCVEDFVSAARSIRHGLKIIGCSANDCSDEFAAVGIWEFLRKPFNLCELEQVLGLRPSELHASDTRIGKSDSGTSSLRFSEGERLRVTVGPLKGLEGTFISVRTGGKILVQLQNGVYVEAYQYRFEKGGS